MLFGRKHNVALLLLALVVSCGNDAPRAKTHIAPNETDTPMAPSRTVENTSPRIDWIRIDPDEPTANENITAVVETFDADGDAVFVRYAWTIDGSDAGHSPTLALRSISKGINIEVSAIANDGNSDSDPAYAYATTRNAIPEIQRIVFERGRELTADARIVVRPEARDRDGDPLDFRYEWSVNGVRVPEEGPVLGTDRMRRGDSIQVAIVATDGEDESEKFVPPPVSLVNAAPLIVSKPGEFSDDGIFRYEVIAKDPDGDRVQFSLENAPAGMSIDSTTGRIAWSPYPDQLGTQTVTVIVEDLVGDRGSQVVELSVDAPASRADYPSQSPAAAGLNEERSSS